MSSARGARRTVGDGASAASRGSVRISMGGAGPRQHQAHDVPPPGPAAAVTSPSCAWPAAARCTGRGRSRRTGAGRRPRPGRTARRPAHGRPAAMPMPSSSTVTTIQLVLGRRARDRDRAAVGRVLERVLQQLADDDVGGHRSPWRLRQVVGDLGDPACACPTADGTALAAPRSSAGQVERLVASPSAGRRPRGRRAAVDPPAGQRPGPLGDRLHRAAAARRRCSLSHRLASVLGEPCTTVIGVRSSWLVVARNRSLASSSSLAAVTSRKSTTTRPVPRSRCRARRASGRWAAGRSARRPGSGSGNGSGLPIDLVRGRSR